MNENVSAEELEQRVHGALIDINHGLQDSLYQLLSRHAALRTELNAREVDNLYKAISVSGLVTPQPVQIAYAQVVSTRKVPKRKRNIESGFFSGTLPTVELRIDYLKAVKEAIKKAMSLVYGPKAPPLLQFVRSSPKVPWTV